MRTTDADSELSRGGNMRVVPGLAYRWGTVLVPVALGVGGLSRSGSDLAESWPWLLALAVAAVVAFVLHSRSHVTVVGPTLRWRVWWAHGSVRLDVVDAPQRSSSRWNGQLRVLTLGRRVLVLHERVWGPKELDRLQSRLEYNARVARPRAAAARGR